MAVAGDQAGQGHAPVGVGACSDVLAEGCAGGLGRRVDGDGPVIQGLGN